MPARDPSIGHRIYADVLVARLRDPAAFQSGSTIADWDQRESYARSRAMAMPGADRTREVDQALRELRVSWTERFGERPQRDVRVLAEEGARLLRGSGGEMVLAVESSDPGTEILRWRYVSLALPAGVLAAAGAGGAFTPPERVRLLHRSFAPDSPVAQQHLHHAAMMSFEEVWAALRMTALVEPGELGTALRKERARCPALHPGRCPDGRGPADDCDPPRGDVAAARHMDEWSELVRLAFIAGEVLRRHEAHTWGLGECSDSRCVRGRNLLNAFRTGGGRRSPSSSATSYLTPDERAVLERGWTELQRSGRRGRDDDGRGRLLRVCAAEERELLVRALARTRPHDPGSADPAYETLLLQYLRVKVAVYGLIVHAPGDPGLRSFLRHFQQIKVYAPEADQLSPREPDEPGLQVRSTEYRVAPDAWLTIVGPRSRTATVLPERPGHETAWLIHFKRTAGSNERTSPRFYSAVASAEGDADRILAALEQDPRRLRKLRGIDICGVEEAQPLWVSAETLRRVRRGAADLARRRPHRNLRPLGLTLHAGEDFHWLTSGMRSIAEPFCWDLLQRGDRIGHGIAVTVHPDRWWRTNRGRRIQVTRFDRLLDIAFLAEYARSRGPIADAWLRREAAVLCAELGIHATAGGCLQAARDIWKALGTRTGRRLLMTARPPEHCADHVRWLHGYFWNQSTRKSAAAMLELRVGGWQERALLRAARRSLISDLARWQVSIESNPSSNLVVAGLEAIGSQDFLARRPTQSARHGEETLTWTISTDDPITFSTSLADEYAYAWAGMVLKPREPYDPAYARALLDEAAETSMRTRFTHSD